MTLLRSLWCVLRGGHCPADAYDWDEERFSAVGGAVVVVSPGGFGLQAFGA